MNRFFKYFLLGAVFTLFLTAVLLGLIFLLSKRQQFERFSQTFSKSSSTLAEKSTVSVPQEFPQITSKFEKKTCPPILEPSGYKLATNKDLFIYDRAYTKEEKPLIFKIDFDNNGEFEVVKVYVDIDQKEKAPQSLYIRSKTLIIQILGKKEGCLQEIYRFEGNEHLPHVLTNGNEIGLAKAMADFWGDGRTVFFFISVNTGYGSGHGAILNFLTFKNGRFKLVFGPTLSELSSFKFSAGAAPGKLIWVAHGIWAENESHFEPHHCRVEKWIWQEEKGKYEKIELGTTKKRYEGCKIDDIMSFEKFY